MGDALQLTWAGSHFGPTDQKLRSPDMSWWTVAARRDAYASANITRQVFNAQSYVAAWGMWQHLALPEIF